MRSHIARTPLMWMKEHYTGSSQDCFCAYAVIPIASAETGEIIREAIVHYPSESDYRRLAMRAREARRA